MAESIFNGFFVILLGTAILLWIGAVREMLVAFGRDPEA